MKELGSNAEGKARELYGVEEDDKNAMDQTYCPVYIDEIKSKISVPRQSPTESGGVLAVTPPR